MKIQRSGSVRLVSALALASALVVACGNDETGSASAESTAAPTEPPATSIPSGGGGDTASSTPTSTAAPESTPDAGTATQGPTADAGGSSLEPNGATCKQGTECQSGTCFVGGKSSYCTVTCTMTGKPDPACQALGAAFTGTCNNKGYCQAK